MSKGLGQNNAQVHLRGWKFPSLSPGHRISEGRRSHTTAVDYKGSTPRCQGEFIDTHKGGSHEWVPYRPYQMTTSEETTTGDKLSLGVHWKSCSSDRTQKNIKKHWNLQGNCPPQRTAQSHLPSPSHTFQVETCCFVSEVWHINHFRSIFTKENHHVFFLLNFTVSMSFLNEKNSKNFIHRGTVEVHQPWLEDWYSILVHGPWWLFHTEFSYRVQLQHASLFDIMISYDIYYLSTHEVVYYIPHVVE